MSSGINLASLPLWRRRSELCLAILREALELLNRRGSLAGRGSSINELDLNRELLRCILEAYQVRARRSDEIPDFYPVADTPNLPLEDRKTSAERTKPDICWPLTDHLVGISVAFRPFVVECKRVRAPSRSWNYNHEYVVSGVARFTNSTHRYGEHSDRGAMVGYWQAMDLDDVLGEINQHLSGIGLPNITLGVGSLRESRQILKRDFPLSPYSLTHLWVDVRAPAASVIASGEDGQADTTPGVAARSTMVDGGRLTDATAAAGTAPSHRPAGAA